MKLTVVIVNYNVKYFLEQCLHSVRRACHGLNTEVFVVDNNSVDGSVKMLSEKFPEVRVFANKDNLGFSKANNQAIRESKGEYVLLLNPDTVVEHDTFSKIVAFMDEHKEAGGLGVKMIDGSGHFLPESKRAFPTPAVAFFKIFGLAKLFPHSRVFGRYHLGYLDKESIHEVEVLAGAFMLLRKETLDKTGLLDEDFFMYGEDIDLSYRIIKAGYKNYYFPETRIIHYKGESTSKSSINYVFMFYNAMAVFAHKHFSSKNARLLAIMIHLAIYFRASLAIVRRFASRMFLPIIDAGLIFGGIYFIKSYWESQVIFQEGGHYPHGFISIAVPLYILIWLFCVYLSGGFDKPVRLLKILQGLFAGTVIILVFYALLSESYRFSRAIIVLGAFWALLSMIGTRLLLHLLKAKNFSLGNNRNKRFVIVGEQEEAGRVMNLLSKTYLNPGFIGLVSISEPGNGSPDFIGSLGQIKDIIKIFTIDEVIFCAKDLPAQKIIDLMSELQDEQVDYKIAPPESMSIIGSNSINTSGELYVIDVNAITKASNLRNKRFLDLIVSLFLILSYPVSVFIVNNPFNLVMNILMVVAGRRSWVGFASTPNLDYHKLPVIRHGILNPGDAFKDKSLSQETIHRLNMLYSRDYKITNDLNIIYRGFSSLGRQ